MRPLAWLALILLLVGACGDDGGDGGEEIEVDAPAGWQEVALPSLGFGLAVPGDWEAVVLSEDGLRVLERADPDVPDFAASALAAHQAGAVFYAAGLDDADEEQVDDLKVLADTASEVEDLAGLEDYARTMVTANDLDNATVTAIEDAPQPIVDVRYQAESGSEEIVVEGVQRFVLATSGAVYVFVVTGEDATSVDDLAPQLLDTVTLPS